MPLGGRKHWHAAALGVSMNTVVLCFLFVCVRNWTTVETETETETETEIEMEILGLYHPFFGGNLASKLIAIFGYIFG